MFHKKSLEPHEDESASPPRVYPFADCYVPLSDFPPLFLDIVSVWGGLAGISPEAAAAILLTVTGGIAGGRVSIDAPMVGDLPPSLQLTVIRDQVPLLRRAIQKIMYALECQIMHWLKSYEHLSDPRAQRNELASLETRLNALLLRFEMLRKTLESDREMRNAFFNQTESQIRAEYDAVCAEIESVKKGMYALRFKIRAMTIVPEFGMEQLNGMDGSSFDRAILEVSTCPGYFHRLAYLPPRSVERLTSFRRNSDWATRLEFVNGSYKPRSSVSSVILATDEEIRVAYGDAVLTKTQLVGQYLVCDPAGEPVSLPDRSDPGAAWGEHVARMFHRRLAGETLQYTFSPQAKKDFQEFLKEHSSKPPSERWEEHWESYPATIAKIALCVRLLRDTEDLAVSRADLAIARWVGKGLLIQTRQYLVSRGQSGKITGLDRTLYSWWDEPDEDPLDVMVGKLRRLGPCTRRTLFRAYKKQDYEQLVPILDRLIALGLAERVGKNYQIREESVEERSVSSDIPSVKPMGE